MTDRCSTCKRTDWEYATTDQTCNDPWHGDAHLRVPYVPMNEGDTLKVQFDPKTREIISAKIERPKKYAVNGRPVTLGEWYEGHGPDDPSGRYYVYDDTPHVTHWMSTGAMQIRMKEIKQ